MLLLSMLVLASSVVLAKLQFLGTDGSSRVFDFDMPSFCACKINRSSEHCLDGLGVRRCDAFDWCWWS